MGARRKTQLRFTTRNYKHELRLDPKAPRSIAKYTDEVWETLCRGVAERDFTGIVFYVGHHPFEYVLDYAGFPEAASQPANVRARVRRIFNRGLAVAHKYGLKTFFQHYITHFTRPLANHLGIATTGRLSNIDHPEIVRYHRWCYREIFRQCPDLDGLYFNFESASNAYDLLMRTSIVEFNRMKRKPIAFYRLWGANDPEGVKKLLRAYEGQSILGHKISDSNDTLYLPVADSRVSEWKKILPDVEFVFLVGPCHNCGTNVCQQLWSDYDFLQEILADAERKGADGISFHSVYEFLSPDIRTKGIFDAREVYLARFNALTLDAVTDYVHGRHQSRRQMALRLAERAGVGEDAGRPLLDAVRASSRIIPLAYQQFCYGSAFGGYLNPGRYSHIQDPFYYYPATEFNNQRTRLMWTPSRGDSSWLQKRADAKVTPDNFLQYIIDYVDPSKPKATRHPVKVAALLEKNIGKSHTAFKAFRRAAGKQAADRLAPFIEENAAAGEYVRHQILAAVSLYGVYFARSRAAILSKLREGLASLRRLPRTLDVGKGALAKLRRVFMFDRFDPKHEINLVRRTLHAVEKTDFPVRACRDYLASRRQYNEIRRIVRPGRLHTSKTTAYAVKHLKAAIARGEDSLAALRTSRHRRLRANVRLWLEFLKTELARSKPPKTACSDEPGEFLPLAWEHGFRAGEHFAEDFLSFFRKMPPAPESKLSFRIWHTSTALVIAMRERGIDPEQRRRQWERYRGSGSDSFVEHIHIDVGGKGEQNERFIIWPAGESVSAGKRPHVKAKTKFTCDATSTTTTVWLSWKLLGKRPRKGDVWGLNIVANPAIERNRCFS